MSTILAEKKTVMSKVGSLLGYLPILPVNDRAGTSRDKQGQGRDKQGQGRDKQGKSGTNRDSLFLSLIGPV